MSQDFLATGAKNFATGKIPWIAKFSFVTALYPGQSGGKRVAEQVSSIARKPKA